MENKISFFELLCLNDENKVHEYIISNGKGPKVKCPITFANDLDCDKKD